MHTFDPDTMFRVVDVAAVVANGLLGGAVARAFRFDIVGFIILATVSGMGGGIIRDLMLNQGFPVALTDGSYWTGALVASVIAYTMDLGSRWADQALVLVDFVGMGCWAATGTAKSLALGLHWVPAMALGITTAVGGGAVRDIIVNRIPSVLGGNSLYATIAFLGTAETVLFVDLLHRPNLGMAAAIVTCGTIGVLARWRNWQLPTPVDLSVPRPRLTLSALRPLARRTPREQGWTPGEPLTQNLGVLTEDQVAEHRRRSRKRRRLRRTR